MGLDSVELIMNVEESFGIQIEDADADQFLTVGQLHELICRKYANLITDSCQTQKVFQQLSDTLAAELEISCDMIHPETATEDIFPEANRKALWLRISEKSQLDFPPLVPPNTQLHKNIFNTTGWMLIVMILLSGLLVALHVPPVAWLLFWLLFIGLFILVLITASTSSIGNNIPPTCQTIGNLAKTLAIHNNILREPYDKEAVWLLLTHMVSEVTGLGVEEITPETHFIEDLGF